LALVAVALVGVCACSAYDSRYQFDPRPNEIGLTVPGVEDRVASVLVSVLGVHKRDTEHDIPASVELRLRIDSMSDEEIGLDPAGLRLFAANLEEFPRPVVPGGPLAVAPHDSGTMTAYFPFPDGKVPGHYDLSGLSARWTLRIGERASTGNATFTRRTRDTDYYPVGIGFGWGWGYYDYDPIYYHHHDRGDHDRGGHRHPAE
jgi:hypothetical protein